MELMTRNETWNITYRHALGETASHFFTSIRDHKKFWADAAATPAACWPRHAPFRIKR